MRIFPEHFNQFDGDIFLEHKLPSGGSICALSDPRSPDGCYVMAFFDGYDDDPRGEIELAHTASSPFRKVGRRGWRLPLRTGITHPFSARDRRAVELAMSEVAKLAQIYEPFRSKERFALWLEQEQGVRLNHQQRKN